jgi:proteasome lid subunit RPN8/RPN11
VLWRPAVQELARSDANPCLIFVAPRAIAAVEDQLRSGPDQGLVGFLVGRVLTNPDTGCLYVVIDRAMPVPQLSVAGASDRLVTQSLAAVQRTAQPSDGEIVGWYRTQPSGEPRISPTDHEAHLRLFPHSWHLALIVAGDATGFKGGVFQPTGDSGSPVPYQPFFELLDPSGDRNPAGASIVSWTNYWSPNPPPRPASQRAQPQAKVERRLDPRPPSATRIPSVVPPSDGTHEADDDLALRRRESRPDEPDRAWRGWAAAAGIVAILTVTAEEWWLHRPAMPSDVPTAPVPVSAGPAGAAEPVRRAIEAYRQRAGLFANREMTCADLAEGLAGVDDAWLGYVRASSPSPDRNLATEVDGVEAEFERSGCPRP